MQRKIASGVILTLLLTSMLTLAFSIRPAKAEPTTIIVPDNYPTIQGAIDAASPRDTIYVKAGTYYENVVVTKNDLTLIGQNRRNTIIDGKTTGSVLVVYARNITIKEFTIRNSAAYQSGVYIGYFYDNNIVSDSVITSNHAGISILSSTRITIKNNNITNNEYAFYTVQSNDNTILNNNITSNRRGIYLDWSNGNNITSNKISENSMFGIGLYRSSSNTIYQNTLISNGIGVRLWGFAGLFSNDNIIYHNNFIDNMNQVQNVDCTNVWDDGYPSGGNYWSDYSAKYPDALELDNSGIWDTPYVIDGNNQDNYPLTEPWTPTPPTATVLAVSPTSIIDPLLGLGSIFHINITVADVQDLAGYELILSYNTSILTAIGCGFDPFFDYPVFSLINDQEGYVYLVAITWSDVGLTTDTPKPIAWIEFSVDSIGTSSLDLRGPSDGSLLGNSMAQPIPHVDVDGLFDNRISIVTSTLDIDPDTLNLGSKGWWITAYVQLPEGYSAEDINASTILLNGTIAPILDPKYGFVTNSSEYLVDNNNDGVLERMVRFDRASIASWIYQSVGMQHQASLTITGQLTDGTPFEGTDIIFVVHIGSGSGRRK